MARERPPVMLPVREWLERIGRASKAKDPDERRRSNIQQAKRANASHPGKWLLRWGPGRNAPWMVNLDLLRQLYPELVDHPDKDEVVERLERLERLHERVRSLERFREKSHGFLMRDRGIAGGKPGGQKP